MGPDARTTSNTARRNDGDGSPLSLSLSQARVGPLHAAQGHEPRARHPQAHGGDHRRSAKDTEVRGQKLAQGDKVYLSYISGNRDEEVFEDPDRFDILRPNAKEHLAFGSGNHFCMGAGLARMQLRILFTEILTRLPDIRVVEEPERLRSLWFNGINKMDVEFTPV